MSKQQEIEQDHDLSTFSLLSPRKLIQIIVCKKRPCLVPGIIWPNGGMTATTMTFSFMLRMTSWHQKYNNIIEFYFFSNVLTGIKKLTKKTCQTKSHSLSSPSHEYVWEYFGLPPPLPFTSHSSAASQTKLSELMRADSTYDSIALHGTWCEKTEY